MLTPDSLRAALGIAAQISDKIRDAQCRVYLARIGIDYPNQFQGPIEPLISEALRIAHSLNRTDIVFLAKRAEIQRLQKEKKHAEAIAGSRSLLQEAASNAELGAELSSILDSVRVDLGVSLRRQFNEQARQEAERNYDEGAKAGRRDSHAGMCRYLQADLYVDRMLDACRRAAQAKVSAPDQAIVAFQEAQRHHERAIQLCEQSREMLETLGDIAARQKAHRRLAFLRLWQIEAPSDPNEAVFDFAVREQLVGHLFLGAPRLDQERAYDPAVPVLTKAQLEQLMNEFFRGVFLHKADANVPHEIVLDSYLPSECVVVIPWVLGDSLEVRLFGLHAGQDRIENLGWFAIDDYVTQVRPTLKQVCDAGDRTYSALIPELASYLSKRTSAIEPIGGSKKMASPFERVIVLPLSQNEDWACRAGSRALVAAEILKKKGYDVRPLADGYQTLVEKGFPKAEKAKSPK